MKEIMSICCQKTFKYLEEIGELGELEDVEDYLPKKE